jgi:hypothetical protein
MKKCNKCKEVKSLEMFSKNKAIKKDGLCLRCKECDKQYKLVNKEQIAERNKQYREANKEKNKRWREANKEKIAKKAKQYQLANKEKLKNGKKEYRKQYYLVNKEKIDYVNKEYRIANKKKFQDYSKKYKLKNPEKIKDYNLINKEKRKKYHITYHLKNLDKKKQRYYERIQTDSVFKFKHRTRNLIKESFKRTSHRKATRTEQILGCSLDFFKVYISNQFQKGMTLENHGKWHLDHIIPLATATTEADVIRLNHYTNFQPLWAEDNLKKSNKIIEKQLQLL